MKLSDLERLADITDRHGCFSVRWQIPKGFTPFIRLYFSGAPAEEMIELLSLPQALNKRDGGRVYTWLNRKQLMKLLPRMIHMLTQQRSRAGLFLHLLKLAEDPRSNTKAETEEMHRLVEKLQLRKSQ